LAEYDLPDGPRQLFEAVREPLAAHLGGEQHFRLGSGTALAMRWAHRHSTDVDLFTDSESYKRLWQQRDAFKRAGTPKVFAVRRWNTKIVLPGGGEVTLFTSSPQTDDPRSDDTVAGTRVPLETNAEILAKKLWGQMLDSEQLLARDFYDFAVARRHDPAAVNAAIDHIDVSDLRQLKRELETLPDKWINRSGQRPLTARRPLGPTTVPVGHPLRFAKHASAAARAQQSGLPRNPALEIKRANSRMGTELYTWVSKVALRCYIRYTV